MKRSAATLVVVLLGLSAFAGCGGSGTSQADEQAIRDLVEQVNRAATEGDAKAACAVIAPSSIREQFGTVGRCVRETRAIFRQAGKQPPVEIESIDLGDGEAKVTFKGRNGEVDVIREDGNWYVPIRPDRQNTESGSDEVGG